MINILKGGTSSIIITVSENMIDLSNGFLFKLENDMSKEVKTFTASNISTEIERYDMFIIDDDELELKVGQWNYKVYESDDQSILDPDLVEPGTILETGRLVVNGTQSYNPMDPINSIYL